MVDTSIDVVKIRLKKSEHIKKLNQMEISNGCI